jgi:hypothetical protein
MFLNHADFLLLNFQSAGRRREKHGATVENLVMQPA